jgi:Glycosyl transferase family 2
VRGPILAPPPRAALCPRTAPPTFSVVIPAYQAAETIADTLASVLAQTVAPHEVIVSDDGSTDALAGAVAPFAPTARLIGNPHRGVAAARNAGLRAASGEFVLVLDADDALLPRKLEALGELAMARPDLDLLSTDVYFEVEGRRAGRFNEANPFATRDQRVAILERCFVGWPAARRDALLAAGGFDESLVVAGDWDCWIRLVLGGALAGLYDEPLSVYRIREGSLSAARATTLRARVGVIERALAHPSLTEEERRQGRRSLAGHAGRAALAEAQEAVLEGRPDARERCLRAARSPGIPLRPRVRALGAALGPARRRERILGAGGRSLLARSAPTWRDR